MRLVAFSTDLDLSWQNAGNTTRLFLGLLSCIRHHGPTTPGAFKNAGQSGAVKYVQMVGLFVVGKSSFIFYPEETFVSPNQSIAQLSV